MAFSEINRRKLVLLLILTYTGIGIASSGSVSEDWPSFFNGNTTWNEKFDLDDSSMAPSKIDFHTPLELHDQNNIKVLLRFNPGKTLNYFQELTYLLFSFSESSSITWIMAMVCKAVWLLLLFAFSWVLDEIMTDRVDHPPRFSQHTIYKSPRQMFDVDICLPMLEKMISSVATDLVTDLDENILYVEANRTSSQSSSNANKATLSNGNQTVMALHSPSLPILEKTISSVATDLLKDLDENILYEEAKRATSQSNPNANTAPLSDGNHNIMSPRQMFDVDICLPMLEKMISSVATDLVTDLDENILYEANRTSSQSSSNANKATLSNGNQTVMALHSPSLPILEKMISSVATDLLKDLDENILYEEAKRATSQSNPNANTAPLSDGNHNIMSPRQMFDVDICLPMLEKMISSVATDLVKDLDENILYEANRTSSQSSSNANKATLSNGNQTVMALHSPSLPILEKMISSVATDLLKDLDENILYEEAKRATSQSNPNANTAPLSDGNHNIMSPRQMFDVDVCLPMLEKMISSVATDLVTDLDENILYEEANRASSQSSSNANKATLSNGNQTAMALHSPSLPILKKTIPSVATDLVKDLDESILYEEAKRTTSQSNPNANTAPLSDGNQNVMGLQSPRQMSDVDICLPMLEKMISRQISNVDTCPVLEKGYRGKRVIKVKALEVAEAAKRREEEKENERKMKKEAFKHAIATRKKEKTPENELNKKKEKGARKRQKVEDERKLQKK